MSAATFWLCFLLAAPPQVSSAQQQSPASSSQSSDSKKKQTADVDDGPNTPSTAAKLLKWQYDATLKDIDKLVKLSTEIKEDMDKAGENVLPLATLKKLDELERLTKKIRGRIKQ
jgi:hypothetical protein